MTSSSSTLFAQSEFIGPRRSRRHDALLRKAVDEFRPMFAEWVATFKDSDYFWDDWGLFNPPGAIPDNDH